MNVLHILSVEMLRDGGSLIISFQSDDSCQYWFTLPIAAKAKSFDPPVLVNRTTNIEVQLTWSAGLVWFRRLASMSEASPPSGSFRVQETLFSMKTIIESNL